MIWVLILNSAFCNVFSFSKNDRTIKKIKTFYHPENKGKNEDFVSDRPGHYSTDQGMGGAYAPHTDPKEVRINEFFIEIRNWLEESRVHHQFENMIIVAEPKTEGNFLKHLNKNLEKMVVQCIQKDIVHMKDHELFDFLMQHVTLSDKS